MKQRLKAFAIHLSISLLILIGLLYLLVFVWYPQPFFTADGGWQGLQLILGVDLVLGPVLTLMVYNPLKGMTVLRRDLSWVALVQVIALVAGTWIVYDQRTRLVVFANNRFVSMSETQIRESGVTPEVRKTLKTGHPPMAYVALPDDPAERMQATMGNFGGKLLFKRGDLYQPLNAENRQKIMAEGFDLADLAEAVPEQRHLIDEFLEAQQRPSSELTALPLYCRYGERVLVMDKLNGEIIDTIKLSHAELIASLSIKDKKDK